MLYLILSILCSTAIALVFKSFNRFEKVNLFHAIVINYWVCAIVGTAALGEIPFTKETLAEPWLLKAVMLGSFFIGTFYIIGKTIAIFGVAVSAVTQRMSLVAPVIIAILYYNEALSWTKGIGVLLALVAVVLTNIKSKKKEIEIEQKSKLMWLLPVVLFTASAIVEVVLQYVQRSYFDSNNGNQLPFTIFLFGTAAVIGAVVYTFNVIRTKKTMTYQSVLGGIALGIPNLGSIYFLLKVLGEMQGSVVFPINNVAVLVLVGIIAYFAFKEKLTLINIVGIVTAILSIVLIGFFN
jgi:drug/metabolite transporter (DMT)-like permease